MKPYILVIEPDRVLADNIRQFLRKRGYQTGWKASAQTAIESADRRQPAAIVLDIQLARHSGVEFLHELRSYADWQAVPVIIYSSVHPDAFGGGEAARIALTIHAYLHKPSASLADLADVIAEALK